MGQQQLLLIVLGVIIVGIAIVAGIQIFETQSEESTKDEIVAHCVNIASHAQQYFRKPQEMGGGGGSFKDYPTKSFQYTKLGSTQNGNYSISKAESTSVTIVGTPKDELGYNWKVQTVVSYNSSNGSHSVQTQIINQ
jgi:hypothetical protein